MPLKGYRCARAVKSCTHIRLIIQKYQENNHFLQQFFILTKDTPVIRAAVYIALNTEKMMNIKNHGDF